MNEDKLIISKMATLFERGQRLVGRAQSIYLDYYRVAGKGAGNDCNDNRARRRSVLCAYQKPVCTDYNSDGDNTAGNWWGGT